MILRVMPVFLAISRRSALRFSRSIASSPFDFVRGGSGLLISGCCQGLNGPLNALLHFLAQMPVRPLVRECCADNLRGR